MLQGIQKSDLAEEVDITLAAPSQCAALFEQKKVDIALLPCGALFQYSNANIVTDYCIGCDGEVNTVALLSNFSLEEIQNVQLDQDSKSSNLLVQILAKNFWKKNWTFEHPDDVPTIDGNGSESYSAVLAIGDKVFDLEKRFKHKWDLGAVWKEMTGLPFVFAVWVSHVELDTSFLDTLNEAMKKGIEEIPHMELPTEDMRHYLMHHISYDLNDAKQAGLQKYLQYGTEFQRANRALASSLASFQ